jgi:hypothetical protein
MASGVGIRKRKKSSLEREGLRSVIYECDAYMNWGSLVLSDRKIETQHHPGVEHYSQSCTKRLATEARMRRNAKRPRLN